MSSPSFNVKNKIYRAGAGAGKTTSLVNEVTEFFQHYFSQNKTPPKVVLTTFTRKATQEMRERLMIKAQALKDQDMLRFVMSKSQLHISTIHGILQTFLKQFGFMMDIDPGFKIISSSDNFKAASRILKRVILNNKQHQDLLESFEFNDLVSKALDFYDVWIVNPEIRFPNLKDYEESMTAILNDLSFRAGQVSSAIEEDTNDQVYLDLAQRLDKISKLLNWEVWLINYSITMNAINNLSKPRKNSKNPKLSEASESELSLLFDALRDLDSPAYNPTHWAKSVKVCEDLNSLFIEFSNQLYEYKTSNGQLQMSDLETLSYRLLNVRPDSLRDFSRQWDYWLIDEFQDTSPLQVKIIDQLIGKSKCFIVGDPQQSIYYFRGARAEVFNNKQDEIISGGGDLHTLATNYRSSFELMSFINDFFHHLNFMKMTPFAKPLGHSQTVAHFIEEENEDGETKSVAMYIKSLLDSGSSPDSIAVISRKNQELKLIAKKLTEQKIPFYIHAASGFGGRREILDALALLKFLVNPYDNKNLTLLLRSPWFKVSDQLLSKASVKGEVLWRRVLECFVGDSIGFESIGRLKKYIELTKTMGISRVFERSIFDTGLLDLSFAYDLSGRRDANIWKLIVKLKSEEHRKGFNYLKFISDIMVDFNISDDDSDAISSVEPNRVNLMTVHVSKGLQFDHVVLPFINKSLKKQTYKNFYYDEKKGIVGVPVKSEETNVAVIPVPFNDYLQKVSLEELEESKRLLYVAITRAKKSVFMSYSGKPLKDSWRSLIKVKLEEGLNQTDLYSYKVNHTFEYKSELNHKNDVSVEIRKPFLEPALWEVASKKQSVTQILNKHIISRPDEVLSQLKSAQQGSDIHRLFELLSNESEESVLSLASKWSQENYHYFKEALEFLKNQKKIPLFDIIKNGKVEWGFLLKSNDGGIEGQVDLWGTVGEEIWIIDYKTGNPRYLNKARQQLELYSLAVQTYTGPSVTKMCAVFPGSKLIEVFESPSLDKLKVQFNC